MNHLELMQEDGMFSRPDHFAEVTLMTFQEFDTCQDNVAACMRSHCDFMLEGEFE